MILKVLEINIIKTLLLNFKLFSFKDAVRLPIIVYGNYTIFDFMSLSRGQMVLMCPCRMGVVRLNRRIGYNIGSGLRGSLCLHGKIIIKGFCDIGQGCNISIRENALLQIGEDLTISGNCKINVYKKIMLGSKVFIAWNTHLHDTDYHYIIRDNKIFNNREDTIEIGNKVWIGHDVTVAKGTSIPSDCIVASHSLVKGRFPYQEGGMLLVGIPAQIKCSNIKPINDFQIDLIINDYFNAHPCEVSDGISPSHFSL